MSTNLERQKILNKQIEHLFEEGYRQLLADTKARKAVNNNLTDQAPQDDGLQFQHPLKRSQTGLRSLRGFKRKSNRKPKNKSKRKPKSKSKCKSKRKSNNKSKCKPKRKPKNKSKCKSKRKLF